LSTDENLLPAALTFPVSWARAVAVFHVKQICLQAIHSAIPC